MDPIKYPKAVWKELTGHSAPGVLEKRKKVVLHITDGPNMDGAFQTFKSSVTPHRVSAHFIIDRDGTVYQLMDLRETAWHASSVNSISIGIEHVAIPPGGVKGFPQGLMASDAQYASSSLLVAWLCRLLKVTLDRTSVVTHNEASPADGHVQCCTGALDPDKVVSMAQAIPEDQIPN